MVMERVDGIPVTDLDALHAQGTDMRLLAERGVETFFTQVFRDSFFHADMHPGNVFVSRENPARSAIYRYRLWHYRLADTGRPELSGS